MRIVSWNCNGAFRNKYEMIAGYQPDVVVAPESESPEFLARTEQNIPCSSHIWDGESAYKGLSVFTFNGYKAYLPDFYSKKFKLKPIYNFLFKILSCILIIFIKGCRFFYTL